tara:strand:- start:8 stop:1351 length:1344 start_codon:yes stop_codon:yes gene_type:complete
MAIFRNNFTNLRQETPDTPFAIPRYGLGCAFYWNSNTTIKLYSDHISQKCFVPVTNGLGDNLTVEFDPGASGMTLDLGASAGAGAIDTGSKEANRFYCVRLISKRGESPALLAHLNGKHDVPGQWQSTFTFSGVPAEDCTLTLVDNASSPATKVFIIDDDASDGTSKIGVENITEYGGGASGTAFALESAINYQSFGINAVVNTAATRVTLFHTYEGTPGTATIAKTGDWDAATSVNIPSAFTALPAFTLPAGYTHYSDIMWGVSVNASGNITSFSTVAPGHCKYNTGGGGTIGKGLQIATAAYTTQTSGTTYLDLSGVVPAPIAGTGRETMGVAYASARAVCTDTSADIDCNLYWSRDGRSTYDPNNEEGLELLCSLQNLGKVDNGSTADLFQPIEVPLTVTQTKIADSFTIPFVGRADNLLQYVFSAAEDGRGLDVWITGWKLNG